MLIVDGHLDIAYNALAHGRDFGAGVEAIRRREGPAARTRATAGLPEALQAGVGLVFATLFALPAGRPDLAGPAYTTPQEAYDQAHAQLAVYHRLVEQYPEIRLIQDRVGLRGLLDARARGEQVLGMVLLMEGADPIRTPDEVAAWFASGVRLVGPAWMATRYCGGTGMPGPLTDLGRALLREMAQAGLALDVSHMAEQSFWQALDRFDGPVVASHSNCRRLVPGPHEDRHLSDTMIRALIERDAVIGVVLYNRFLVRGWEPGASKQAVGLADVIHHIHHVCDLAGNARHVALGSDLDGGFGAEAIPRELDTIADLPRLADALAATGFSDADVRAVMGANWIRTLETFLPA